MEGILLDESKARARVKRSKNEVLKNQSPEEKKAAAKVDMLRKQKERAAEKLMKSTEFDKSASHISQPSPL